MICALCECNVSDEEVDLNFSHLCMSCGADVGSQSRDDGPYLLPDEFPDDGVCDFTEEDVVT